MNRPSDNKRLFTDALADTAPAGFREALIGDTLRRVRRQRQFRQARRIGAALAMVALLSILFWPRTAPRRNSTAEPPAPSYRLVNTTPLPASAIIVTQPFLDQTAVSTQAVSVVTTAQSHDGLRELNDDELLALAPAPALLVRLGPHSAELVLENQERTDFQ